MHSVEEVSIDPWLPRLHLVFEFVITVAILVGSFMVVVSTATSPEADSGAAAVVTLVVGYWFGRSSGK